MRGVTVGTDEYIVRQYFPLGLSAEAGEELIKAGVDYRMVEKNELDDEDRIVREYHLLLSQADADSYGITYFIGEWWKLKKSDLPYNLLCNDGRVLTITGLSNERVSKKLANGKWGPVAHHIIRHYGAICHGTYEPLFHWIGYHRDIAFLEGSIMRRDQLIRQWYKYAKNPVDDPRLKAFCEIVMATGDSVYAVMMAYRINSHAEANVKARLLLELEETQRYMNELGKEVVEKALRRRNISDVDPEQWILERYIEVVQTVDANAKAAGTRIAALKEITALLGYGKKERKGTTAGEVPEQSAEGTLTQEDVDRIKKETQEDINATRGTETTTGSDSSTAETSGGNLFKLNDEGKKSAVS